MTGLRCEAWGLGELVALARLACGEWEPPRSLFDRGRDRVRPEPGWWPVWQRVWLLGDGGSLWALACDSRAACAFEMRGSAPGEPVGVPSPLLLALSGKSPRGGAAVAVEGGSGELAHLYKGYTGQVGRGRPARFAAMPAPPSVMRVFRETVDRGEARGTEVSVEPSALAAGLAALGERCAHWMYSPARVSVSRGIARAWSDDAGAGRCAMACACRMPVGDGDAL